MEVLSVPAECVVKDVVLLNLTHSIEIAENSFVKFLTDDVKSEKILTFYKELKILCSDCSIEEKCNVVHSLFSELRNQCQAIKSSSTSEYRNKYEDEFSCLENLLNALKQFIKSKEDFIGPIMFINKTLDDQQLLQFNSIEPNCIENVFKLTLYIVYFLLSKNKTIMFNSILIGKLFFLLTELDCKMYLQEELDMANYISTLMVWSMKAYMYNYINDEEIVKYFPYCQYNPLYKYVNQQKCIFKKVLFNKDNLNNMINFDNAKAYINSQNIENEHIIEQYVPKLYIANVVYNMNKWPETRKINFMSLIISICLRLPLEEAEKINNQFVEICEMKGIIEMSCVLNLFQIIFDTIKHNHRELYTNYIASKK